MSHSSMPPARPHSLPGCELQYAAELREEGLALTWIRSFALLEDDTYVWIVEAAALDDVARIQRRAGMELDHVVEAVPGERGAARRRGW